MRFLTLLFSVATLAAQWDSVASRSEVLVKLHQRERQPRNPFCDYQGCKVTHEVIGEYDLPYKTRHAKLIVAASTDPHHDCHACAPQLSFFEYTLRNGKWALTDSQFAVAEWGQFGAAYNQGITVEALGDDFYGVFLAGGGTNQGITQEFTRILARLQNQFRVIGSIQTAEEDGDRWSAAITVDPHPARVHDLIVKTSGTRDGKEVNTTERYRFDGSEYGVEP